jgi:histidinol-phosphate aminotransferase
VTDRTPKTPRLRPALQDTTPYTVPRRATPTDLRLAGNEGPEPPSTLINEVLAELEPATLREYPSARALELDLARRLGCAPAELIVTAGADDALWRACQCTLGPGRDLLVATPTFAMLPRYAELLGARLREVPWPDGPYPVDAILERLDDGVGAVALVSPNNPTGCVLTADDLRRVCEADHDALVLLDHAYVEFADEDLTSAARDYPNVVVARTLSKAWGLAGLRVGFATGAAPLISAMRAAGNPYAVSGPSLVLARARLELSSGDIERFVARARDERVEIAQALTRLGARTTDSHANFAFARTPRAVVARDALASLGIATRAWPGDPALGDAIRISCPGSKPGLDRLLRGLEACRPEAILLDMDGVMVDVSQSYRGAIIATAARYGVEVTPADIRRVKLAGDANNDWVVTQRLLAQAGQTTTLDAVTAIFEQIYQGTDGHPGLRETERPLADRAFYARLVERGVKLGVVTGRPRADAARFLDDQGIADLFEVVVCMEDGPAKPAPDPVLAATRALGVRTAGFVGDTPDDAAAARAATATREADVVAWGVFAPGERSPEQEGALLAAGAGRVLNTLTELEELL